MVTYILSILILWFLIVVLMISDKKSRANQWLAATMFIASFVGIGDVFLELSKTSVESSELLLKIGTLFNISSCAFFYTYLNFAFYSSRLLTENKFWRRYFPILTLLPTVVVFSLIKHLDMHFENSMISLIIWKNIYSVIGYIFLTAALFVKKNRKDKMYHLKIFLFMVPTVLFIHVLNDYAYIFGNLEMHKNDFWIILYAMAIYIFFLTKEGFMGMSIKIERSRLQGNVETLNMASVFLTHNFKNEVVKISEFVEKIKNEINNSDNEKLGKWFSYIDESEVNINKMMDRIKDTYNENILINKKIYPVSELMSNAIKQITHGDKQRNLIEINIDENINVSCDLIYTAKVITNILDNAYEALKGTGNIKIRAFQSEQFCVIEITDNGPGISKENMKHIMKPFYSTKTSGSNMGLGLTYCYNIITESGGKFHIQSELGEGTIVSIYIEKEQRGVKG